VAKYGKMRSMDVDQFAKTVHPGVRKSHMNPFMNDLLRLRKDGYTLKQIQEFLSTNGVSTSISNLARFLKRQDQPQKTQLPAITNKARPAPQVEPQDSHEADGPPVIGLHNPRDLDAIIANKPDLDALAKYAKRNNK